MAVTQNFVNAQNLDGALQVKVHTCDSCSLFFLSSVFAAQALPEDLAMLLRFHLSISNSKNRAKVKRYQVNLSSGPQHEGDSEMQQGINGRGGCEHQTSIVLVSSKRGDKIGTAILY
jgi:hypothetical protein